MQNLGLLNLSKLIESRMDLVTSFTLISEWSGLRVESIVWTTLQTKLTFYIYVYFIHKTKPQTTIQQTDWGNAMEGKIVGRLNWVLHQPSDKI